jgi:hypothetical protein
MTADHLPYIERYGYTWLQHPDGLYYGPLWPNDNAQLVLLESKGSSATVRYGAGSIAISCGSLRRMRPDDSPFKSKRKPQGEQGLLGH